MIQEEHLSKLNNTGQNTSIQEGEKREKKAIKLEQNIGKSSEDEKE